SIAAGRSLAPAVRPHRAAVPSRRLVRSVQEPHGLGCRVGKSRPCSPVESPYASTAFQSYRRTRPMTPARRVVVFGGTGFLGQRVVRHLLDRGFAVRIATRHPDRSRGMVAGKDSGLESIWADINEDRSLLAAVCDAFAVVNAV